MVNILVILLVSLLANSLALKIYAASVNKVLEKEAVEYNENRSILDSLFLGIYNRSQAFRSLDFFISLLISSTSIAALHLMCGEDILLAAFHSVVLTSLFMADFRHWLLPNIVVFPAFFIELGLQAIYNDPQSLLVNLSIAVSIFLLFYLIYIISTLLKKEIGGGDVKVMLFLSMWLGPWVLLVLLAASLLAMVYSLATRAKTAPFGPFLVIGALTVSVLAATVGNPLEILIN